MVLKVGVASKRRHENVNWLLNSLLVAQGSHLFHNLKTRLLRHFEIKDESGNRLATAARILQNVFALVNNKLPVCKELSLILQVQV